MRLRVILTIWVLGLLMIGSVTVAAEDGADHAISLYTRSREKNPEADGQFEMVYKSIEWDARKTAVVVCDMWDKHWCKSATKRVGEMAPRMNRVLKKARAKGALIIHCPSGCMDKYEGTPGRKLAQQAPKVETKIPLERWCHLDEKCEAALPIDDSDGGCSDGGTCKTGRAWSRQIDVLEIEDCDGITDSAEAYYLMRQRGIENVIVLGVHTNMCVLGRPFSIRQMIYQDMNVVLMRDMTDSMYNPRMRPQVSHVRGTELVIEHIEKHWCPTVTSSDFLGGPAFRFEEDDRPHVAVLVSDDHYLADETLPEFAQMLRERYGCHVTVMHGEGTSNIPATDELEEADCLVLYIRRLALPKEQLESVRRYIKAGKPLVGLRTACHAFDVRGKALEGQAEWPEFDPQVLGGNYHGHGPNPVGSDISIVAEKADHPILAGIKPAKWHSTGSLYVVSPLKPDCNLLMTGSAGDEREPITWTRTVNGRMVFSALGHADDFVQPQFRQLLVNMVFWAMDRAVPTK
jgi:type 1 glutamine amidotransferase/nicotinamidase-related amidase